MLLVSLDGAKQIIDAIDGLRTGTPRAIVRALNRGIGSARTVEVKAIAQDTGLKAGDVREKLTVASASIGRPMASLSASTKRLPLMAFKAQDRRPKGVSYKLQGGRQTVADAFIATMRSGHQGVFARKGAKRLPIRELFGPSIGHVFQKYRPEAIARAQESFVASFEHEMSGAWNGTPVPAGDGAADADAQ